MQDVSGAGRLRALAALTLTCALFMPRGVLAQEHGHGEEHEHDEDHRHGMPHFSHPLVAESVTPDTKVRLDTHFADGTGGSTLALVFEAEYAFAPAFSIEVGTTPYTHASPAASPPIAFAETMPAGVRASLASSPAGTAEKGFSDLDVAFKFANFAFAEHGVLLGYGAELGLPLRTEGEPVHAITRIEPFLNIGYQRAGWELEGFVRFGIPTAAEDGAPGNADLATNASVLRHLGDRLQALLELDTGSPLGGGEDPWVAHLTPGLKVQPLPGNEHLIIGGGVRLPVSGTKLFDEQGIVSIFWHF